MKNVSKRRCSSPRHCSRPASKTLWRGPKNTLPMMSGEGPHVASEMGGMFTVVKVRDDLARGDYLDPGWYAAPKGTVAAKVSSGRISGSRYGGP